MNAGGSSNAAYFPPMDVFSYGGTSQYTAGGPSACGLASVNAALLVLSLLGRASSTDEALDTIRSQEFVEKIMEICSLWKNEGHLDVDDVLALPMFATSLGILAVEGNWCGRKNFRALYSLLRDDTYTVAIITRPPEIVALFNIPSGDPDLPAIPILFDSHPRPHLHPRGAAFIFFLNEEGPVEYLSSLFQTDKALVESKTWDASLLGQYTAHILKLKMSTQAENERAFYQANIRILAEQASLRDAGIRETALNAEIASLRGQVAIQQQQIDRAMAEETVSRDELNFLRREVERLKRATAHEQSRGSWVEVVSRKGGPPSRKPSTTTQNHEPAVSQGGKQPAFRQGDNGTTSYSKYTPTAFWPFNVNRPSNEGEKAPLNEEARAYERARQQNAREEMSRWKEKAKNVPPKNPFEQARQKNAREEMSPWKGKGKDIPSNNPFEQALQQNGREELPPWKQRAKNIPPKNSTPSTSTKPARLPATASPLPSNAPPSKPLPSKPPPPTKDDAAHARVLQAQLDTERASYELARRLQAQEEAAHQEHRRLVEEEASVKFFDCVICMERYSLDYSAPIRSCGHALCRTCMKGHVQSQVSQSIWPIRCPTCVADHSRTEEHGVITRDLVETLGIDEAVIVRWVKLEMDRVSITVECPSCREAAAVDPVDFREASELSCPLGCGAHWCKQCNITFERGGIHSCDGQAEMDHLLGQKDWKKCPACQVPVEKLQGCNHMTCRCHCHFCYICGGEITRSVNRREIDRELQAHYQKDCKLFEYPE